MASLTCHGGGGAKQVRLERIVRQQSDYGVPVSSKNLIFKNLSSDWNQSGGTESRLSLSDSVFEKNTASQSLRIFAIRLL